MVASMIIDGRSYEGVLLEKELLAPGPPPPSTPPTPGRYSRSHNQAGTLQHCQAAQRGPGQKALAVSTHQHHLPRVLQQEAVTVRHGRPSSWPGAEDTRALPAVTPGRGRTARGGSSLAAVDSDRSSANKNGRSK